MMVALLPIIFLIAVIVLLIFWRKVSLTLDFIKRFIQIYLGIIAVLSLLTFVFIYPQALAANVEGQQMKSSHIVDGVESPNDLPDDYLVEKEEISDPPKELQVEVDGPRNELNDWPEIYVSKEAGRETIEMTYYRTPHVFSGIDISDDFPQTYITFSEGKMILSTDEPAPIEKKFQAILYDNMTAQFTDAAVSDIAENSYYESGPDYIELRLPEEMNFRYDDERLFIEEVTE